MINTRELLEDRLPATPVTRKMREQVHNLAQVEGCSMADVQRAAIEFFLRHYGMNSTANDTIDSDPALQIVTP